MGSKYIYIPAPVAQLNIWAKKLNLSELGLPILEVRIALLMWPSSQRNGATAVAGGSNKKRAALTAFIF